MHTLSPVLFAVLGLDRALYAFLPGEEKRLRGILVENLLLLNVLRIMTIANTYFVWREDYLSNDCI